MHRFFYALKIRILTTNIIFFSKFMLNEKQEFKAQKQQKKSNFNEFQKAKSYKNIHKHKISNYICYHSI